jgi:hypothetical protein
METNMTLDAVKFMRSTLEDMRGDINYAYPSHVLGDGKGNYESGRGHAALQMVGSKIETLTNFLNAIEMKVVEKVEMPPLPMIERRRTPRTPATN